MCPDCGAPLIVLEFEGVEIDYCVSCHGVWLDRGELEQILTQTGAQAGGVTEAVWSGEPTGKSDLRCARCGARMDLCEIRSVHDPALEALEIDRCPRGHGIWFERGELQAASKRFIRPGGDGTETQAVATFFGAMFADEMQESESRQETPPQGNPKDGEGESS